MIEHEGVHEVADKVYVYTHKQFSISFHNDRIIEVNLTSQRPVLLDEQVYVAIDGPVVPLCCSSFSQCLVGPVARSCAPLTQCHAATCTSRTASSGSPRAPVSRTASTATLTTGLYYCMHSFCDPPPRYLLRG
mgnify:CR=1 FL=1